MKCHSFQNYTTGNIVAVNVVWWDQTELCTT